MALLLPGLSAVARAQLPAADRAAIVSVNPGPGILLEPTGQIGLAQAESNASLTPQEREKLWRRFSSDRQRSMVSDVQRLLELTGELRAELGDTGRAAPSADEPRMVDEIRKLANNVKENMKLAPMPE